MAKNDDTAEERSRNNGKSTGYASPPVEHQFKPGNQGRPKGARNKLGEDFLDALQKDFAAHGIEVIEKVRTDRPDQYLKVIASILPKEVATEFTHHYVARLPAPVSNMDEWLRLYGPHSDAAH